MFLALAGCSGLPSFNLPGQSGAGGASVNGQALPDLAGGSSAPPGGTQSSSSAPAVPPGTPDQVSNVPLPGTPAPLPETPRVGWLVQFPADTSPTSMKQTTQGKGGAFVFSMQALPIAYVLATDSQAADIGRSQGVLRVEREAPIHFDDAQSMQAIRIPDVVNPVTGLHDALGNPIDGRGIGIAEVDTGIYALHADLPYGPQVPGGVVASNLKVESLQYVPLADTDTTSGHGTHVAAIIAGQGTTDPTMRGVAPGSRLYGLGVGELATNVWAAQAFDWIVVHHAQVTPPIRIVSNSWSTGTVYDPSSTITQYVNYLVDQGMVVVFSAGNNGGNGTTIQTSAQCQIPKAGVVCVAAYDDLGTGTRNGVVASYTSRGLSSQTSTWPDLSAPGTKVMSARPPVGYVTGTGLSTYVELSGTSQAAPHVTGIVALMLQKNPTLTPAQIEGKLKSSAYKFTDGGAYTNGMHLAKGAGLADAYAAVLAA